QVSRTRGRPVSLEETLEEMTGFYLRHKDPVEKAKRVIAKKSPTKIDHSQVTGPVKIEGASKAAISPPAPGERVPIPKSTEHEVRLRDQNRCQAKKGQTICGETRFIDLHHVKPVCEGGSNDPQNLVTLCRA